MQCSAHRGAVAALLRGVQWAKGSEVQCSVRCSAQKGAVNQDIYTPRRGKCNLNAKITIAYDDVT